MSRRRWARSAVLAQVALVTAAVTAVRPMLIYPAIDLDACSTQIVLLATTYALLPVLFAFSVGRQIDQRGPVRFLIAGALVSVIGAVLAIVGPRLAVLYVATAGLGIGQQFSVLSQQSAVAAVPAASATVHSTGSVRPALPPHAWPVPITSPGTCGGPAIQPDRRRVTPSALQLERGLPGHH